MLEYHYWRFDMIFSSISFLFYFLPIVVLIYKFTPTKCTNIILVISSLFFYAWGEPKYVLLMLFSTIVDYTIGLCIGHYLEQANGKTKAKCFMVLSICINLGLLFFFKYTNLIASSIQSILSLEFSIPSVALPIGISFYTFQTMSYSIDVYRRKVAPQKNIIDFATYVTLFPQLIAGPIVRYATVETELKSRTSNYDKGTKLFLLGLAQKVLIANNMGLMWEEIKVLPYDSLGMATSWLGIFAFAIQIFFDFCGYSNMAIGLGYFFGFHFPINFDKPYISKFITEFWHRWHISLSTWFKEYVYIPLGGNRNGLALQIRNILIVWLLTGFCPKTCF